MATPNADTDELAKFGYKQELDRSLGLFSSFAAGFSYISVMTGVFELFFFGFGSGGPAFIWTWPAVFAGQFLVALCFAELAGQYPLAGSVYQWAKQIARPFTAWFGGWILSVGAVVTLAAVAVAYQVVAPQISSAFQIIGGPADIGPVSTPDGAKNALLLAAGLVVFTFTGLLGGLGIVYYLARLRGRPAAVLAEHRAEALGGRRAGLSQGPWTTSRPSWARIRPSTCWRRMSWPGSRPGPRSRPRRRVLDLLGPGELFGHASMISGLPTGFEARAAQDTVCYRIPADVIRPLLARPDVLRFVVRSIVSRGGPSAPRRPSPIRGRSGWRR